jgi:aconitate hydratase
VYSDVVELDLGDVVPSLAGPKRPQDRVSLDQAQSAFREALEGFAPAYDRNDEESAASFPSSDPPASSVPGSRAAGPSDHSPSSSHGASGAWSPGHVAARHGRPASITLADGRETTIDDGHVVIAAITSCTNTSNPSVMVGAGILARNAVARGLKSKPWVKTSLAPGSKVVTEYLRKANLTESLVALGFHLVGYGCTTCIGNSGPLPAEISKAVTEQDLAVVSVLSGNRNFEGRIHSEVKMNYLASPPLCVAYALAGTMDIDLVRDPLGEDVEGKPVYLRDLWPSEHEIAETVHRAIHSDMFRKSYSGLLEGDRRWNSMVVSGGDRFAWEPDSSYVRLPPYFTQMPIEPEPMTDIVGARVLAVLGDSVTTDHISPAGAIKKGSPASDYLEDHGVERRDYNSYGSRRGNHEVMVRGTFANVRLRNLLAPGTEGGVTRHLPAGEEMSIYDAATKYAEEDIPLVVLAGSEYGSGSSRDWAAKGTLLLGVRAVIAESFERIHRSNLVGMGVLPLEFADGESADSLGLTGEEEYSIVGVADLLNAGELAREATVRAGEREFRARVRIDTPKEAEYFRHGGILQYVLRGLVGADAAAGPS